jgi:hypothetical protein
LLGILAELDFVQGGVPNAASLSRMALMLRHRMGAALGGGVARGA